MRILPAARLVALLGSLAAFGLARPAGAQGSAKPKAAGADASHHPAKPGASSGKSAGKSAAKPPGKGAAPAKSAAAPASRDRNC